MAIKPGIDSQINRKAATARQNGKKGGRPRKQKEETPAPASSSQPTSSTAGDIDSHRQPEADTAPAAPPSGDHGTTGTTDSRETARKDVPQPPALRPPTIDEVRARAKELGAKHINIDKFYNHYEGKEWKAPNGQPLINWANKLLEWDAEDKAKGKPERPTPSPPRAPSSAVSPTRDTSAGTKQNEHHKAEKTADYIRSKGYDPEEWENKYPAFLAMIREREQQPT